MIYQKQLLIYKKHIFCENTKVVDIHIDIFEKFEGGERNFTLERKYVRTARFPNVSILTDGRSFPKDLRSRRGRILVRCWRTLYAVTDKIGSRHRSREETKKRRDECRSRRRFYESAIRMSFERISYVGRRRRRRQA